MIKMFFRQVFRYRIPEIVFWVAKYLSLAHQIADSGNARTDLNYVQAAVVISFQVISVYTCLSFLLPRYYFRRKYGRFVLYLLLLFTAAALATEMTIDLYGFLLGRALFDISPLSFISHFIDIVIITGIFSAIYLVVYYYRRDRENKRKEKQRLEDELYFLRAQINPHFLFNVLNSIYVLMDENKKQAGDILLRFSNLLRYQLYKSADGKVSLREELSFIKDYIEIEKVREYENLEIEVHFPEPQDDLHIASLILITFIENAFKHVSHYTDRKNRIQIEVKVQGRRLDLLVVNTCGENDERQEQKGIGIKNVKRRLELLYPGKHRLSIRKDPPLHTVQLSMELYET